MSKLFEGQRPEGTGIAIAVADFNADVTDALLQGCLSTLVAHGIEDDAISVVRVPGAFELPLTCAHLAARGNLSAIIALGAVIRGDTPHFDYVAGETARGIMQVGIRTGLPVVFGVLTTDTLEQALHRCVLPVPDPAAEEGRTEKSTPPSNKGAEAALTALRMIDLLQEISS